MADKSPFDGFNVHECIASWIRLGSCSTVQLFNRLFSEISRILGGCKYRMFGQFLHVYLENGNLVMNIPLLTMCKDSRYTGVDVIPFPL